MEQIHRRAAGIDIGSYEIYVSVPEQPVRRFTTFTEDVALCVNYLREHKITTAAMEATGVYWMVLYEMMEAAKIEVYLVNGRYVKRVPGRKTDVLDCQWLQQLHSYGLLSKGFVPAEEIRALRSYQRLREDHVERAADAVRHMQKALDLMNIKLHTVISQLHGVSGLRVIRAILKGERDPAKLTALCDDQILKTKCVRVERSLQGNWKKEHLFSLGEALSVYEFYQSKITLCDHEIEKQLDEIAKDKEEPAPRQGKTKPIRHNAPQIKDLETKLLKISEGKDPTLIPGLTDKTFLQLVAELGVDMSKWPTRGQFTSWLGLAPNLHQSGHTKKRYRGRKKTKAGQIFRVVAQSIGQSKKKALGGFYRRIEKRRGASVAIVATARKLAACYYDVMKHGIAYVEQGLEVYEHQLEQQLKRQMQKLAAKFKCQIIPNPTPATP